MKRLIELNRLLLLSHGRDRGMIQDLLNEPVREKTNNLDSDKVRHKPACTVTEAG